ncbi:MULTISPECIES: LTA synthase family protein [Mesorhizobium]|uniref:LTA synthase family protein n=1 Tax=Mesorhizobium denitrificans TaxID=2294114 RepID=A0A371XIR6_9HYPH|nr:MULTISPECIES: LTA synthase family protein [Mesorhizobium]RFC69101.1 LTA synthase family protein [Mesorhizobium denitrificans]
MARLLRSRQARDSYRALGASVFLSAALVFLIELVARGDFISTVQFFFQPFKPGWTTIIVFTLVLTLLDAIFARRHIGILIVAPLTLLLAFVGHQKAHYLGDPLYPTDFLYSRQIMELMPLLVRDRPWLAVAMAVVGVTAICALVAMWRFWRRNGPKISRKSRIWRLTVAVPALAFFVSIMDYATFSWTRDRLQIIPIMWDQKENYASNGFALAFAMNVPMAKVNTPQGYTEQALADIAPPDGATITLPEQKPDIIIVMSESFWDPTRLPGVKFTPDPIPNVRAAHSGHVFSPEFGGMTANVEFEALTGFSNAFLPYGSIPYQQYVRKAVPSLASFFRSQGYETMAIHPFEGWFWNRKAVYDAFGFDRFYSIENLPPMKARGPLISDESLTEEIIRRADQTERPFFYFAVSLQSHGPYEPYRYSDPVIKVSASTTESTRQSILSYAEGAHDADKELKRLMDWAQQRERPTIIAFFGDHLPPLNLGYVETKFLKEPVPDRREPPDALALHRETPLVVWSNKSGSVQDIGTVSPAFLPLYVLKTAGISHPYYTGFLGELNMKYHVVERHVLVDADGKPTPDWAREKQVDPMINDYRLLQYDAMFGKAWRTNAFFPNLPKPSGV